MRDDPLFYTLVAVQIVTDAVFLWAWHRQTQRLMAELRRAKERPDLQESA